MDYREYTIENGESVNLEELKTGFITREDYVIIHRDSALLCADVLIWYKDGWLLIKRNTLPLIGEYCTVGGRVHKGVPIEIFLKQKVKEECNLDISNLNFVGVGRAFFKTDPFNHGNGTDTTNLMYLAEGKGDLKIDKFHSEYILVNKKIFTKIKDTLHPYFRDFLEIAFSIQAEQ